ncbi:MAG: ABC transporter substrate binding protein [Calditrichia bacterium]
MKKMLFLFCLIFFAQNAVQAANSPTPLQIFFLVKKIFPEIKEVSVLVTKDLLETEKTRVTRAAAQTQMKVVLYPVENATDIGTSFKEINDKSFVVIYDTDILSQKSNKLYILSKCKEKRIPLITTSPEYTESGALIGILAEGNDKTDVVVNLKHSDSFQSKFTSDFIRQAGISRVIQ